MARLLRIAPTDRWFGDEDVRRVDAAAAALQQAATALAHLAMSRTETEYVTGERQAAPGYMAAATSEAVERWPRGQREPNA